MSGFSVRIDLLKIRGAFTMNIKGRTGKVKPCLILPLDIPCVYRGEKGIYLNADALEMRDSKYGDSHFLKPNVPREEREGMTAGERDAIPIIGSMRPIVRKAAGMPVNGIMREDDYADLNGGMEMPF